MSGEYRTWDHIIPNMQLVVIPKPLHKPGKWKIRQFVRISDKLQLFAGILLSVCVGLLLIIFGLCWRERKEDKIEKVHYHFHYDAM